MNYNQGDVNGARPLSWTTVDRRAVTAVFLPTSFRKAAADRSVMFLVTCVTTWVLIWVSMQGWLKNTEAFLGMINLGHMRQQMLVDMVDRHSHCRS